MTVHPLAASPARTRALLCLSHLRWDFVYQRPQHLMSRLAKTHRVLFFEEPVRADDGVRRLTVREAAPGVRVFVPCLTAADLSDAQHTAAAQRSLLNELVAREHVEDGVLWFYTPMAQSFAGHLVPRVLVYDCMDELSAFAGAPPEMRAREARLLTRADLVLTGGRSLYLAKRNLNPHVHCIPSSVDVLHFRQARRPMAAPADQAAIPGPRIGFAGVIDERMDLALVDAVAAARPDFHLVMVGPIAKIDPATLPRRPNIHYLGMKTYADLPGYLSGWDAAIMPFARNAATRFISPTKTPEYLAAGLPVVSTSIPDVVATYGAKDLALIADTSADFVSALDSALKMDRGALWRRADGLLEQGSWDRSVGTIETLLAQASARTATVDASPRSVAAAR